MGSGYQQSLSQGHNITTLLDWSYLYWISCCCSSNHCSALHWCNPGSSTRYQLPVSR